MAQLITTTGEVIDFEPAAVVAVANMDVDTGEAVTCVYGIEAGALRTAETVVSLIRRLGLAMKVAELTRPDGSPIWIVGSAVTSLRAPLPDEYTPGVEAVVVTSRFDAMSG